MKKIWLSPGGFSYYQPRDFLRYKIFAWHGFAVELEWFEWDFNNEKCIKITLHGGGKYVASLLESPTYLWPVLKIMKRKLDQASR